MNQIMLMLGLNASGLFGGLKRASDQVKGFERDWRGLSKIFGAGGLTYLVTGFFDAMIEAARKSKGNLDENYEAVRRFGTALDEGRATATNWGVNLLGWLNRVGEAAGGIVTVLRDGARDDYLAESTGKAAESAERSLAKANEHAAEFKRITAGIKSETERLAEARLKGLTVQEQFNARENELYRLVVQRANFEGTALERRELDLKIAQARTKVVEAEVALSKEQAAAERQAAQEQARTLEKSLDLEERRLEFIREGLPLAEQITQLKAEEARLNRESLDQTLTVEDLLTKQNRLLEVQGELRKLVADEAERAAKAEAAQVELAQRNAKLRTDFTAGIVMGGYSAEQIQEADAAALREALARNNARLPLLRQNPGSAFDFGNSLEISRLENENRRIQRELDFREDFVRAYQFNPEAARRGFAGDPLVFDRLVQELVEERTELGELNSNLRQLSDGLLADNAGNLRRDRDSLATTMERGLQSLSEQVRSLAQRRP